MFVDGLSDGAYANYQYEYKRGHKSSNKSKREWPIVLTFLGNTFEVGKGKRESIGRWLSSAGAKVRRFYRSNNYKQLTSVSFLLGERVGPIVGV